MTKLRLAGLDASGARVGPDDDRSYPMTRVSPLTTDGVRADKSVASSAGGPDDLSREVYGILGIPIDAVDIQGVIQCIERASASHHPYLISTPNLNFLVSSQTDWQFRRSLLLSELCPVDGVPIVWIARLLGIPIRGRVAGSDIFDALKSRRNVSSPAKVYLFGGPEGVASAAAERLNATASGVVCVGAHYPGYCAIEEMSTQEIIEDINSSGADFLVISLGAQKGQAWLLHNHANLRVPVRSHLGAAINFQGGTLKRAPLLIRKIGLEWLWRIRAEPHLWRRYFQDGTVLMRLLLTRVLPLAFVAVRQRSKPDGELGITAVESDGWVSLGLTGAATATNVEAAVPVLREAISKNKPIRIDVSALRSIDARFFGLLLMVWKQVQRRQSGKLSFVDVPTPIRTSFRLNGFGFLLDQP